MTTISSTMQIVLQIAVAAGMLCLLCGVLVNVIADRRIRDFVHREGEPTLGWLALREEKQKRATYVAALPVSRQLRNWALGFSAAGWLIFGTLFVLGITELS